MSGYVEIDYQVVERFNFYCNPTDHEINPLALELCKKTEDQLFLYPHPSIARKAFIKILEKYIKRFDKYDKFTLVGYNSRFDLDFLSEWLQEGGEQYLFSFISPCTIDAMNMVAVLQYLGLEDYSGLKNKKLTTVCKHHGIPLDDNAHDAVHDIEATRLLTQVQMKLLEGIQ